MGWLFSYGDTRAQIIDRLTREGEHNRTVAKACVGNTMYVVHEYKQARGMFPAGYRWIGVYLLAAGNKSRGEGWGYKDMDETMGPNECDCPVKLLDLADATPPLDERAREWREICRKRAERKQAARESLKVGARFRLYGNVYEVARREGQRILIRKEATGQIFRLSRPQLAQLEILQDAPEAESAAG